MFNQGYYYGEEGSRHQQEEESPFGKSMNDNNPFNENDGINYENENLTSMKLEGGILNNYKRVTGETVRDMMEGDYWRANRDMKMQVAEFFNHVTSNE